MELQYLPDWPCVSTHRHRILYCLFLLFPLYSSAPGDPTQRSRCSSAGSAIILASVDRPARDYWAFWICLDKPGPASSPLDSASDFFGSSRNSQCECIWSSCVTPKKQKLMLTRRLAVLHLHGYNRLYDCQLRAILRISHWRQRLGKGFSRRYRCHVLDTILQPPHQT